ncbi:MAG: carbohydrate ABC transporter permease [Candidatus Izemoplasmatales bacterium]|jgi:raffinose/stachyose/melibiose transport system permease protein
MTERTAQLAKIKSRFATIIKYSVLISLTFIVILPMIPIFFGSFKTNYEFYSSSVWALPKSFLNFENYRIAFTQGNMLLSFGNTLLIMVVSITISVMIGSMTAYVLQRFRFRGRKAITFLFLFAALLPTITLNIAIFSLMSWIGRNLGIQIINTRFAAIILFSGTDIITVYIFMQFLKHIPLAIDESAIIDGASYFRIFFSIIMPLLVPAITTVVILKFVAIYNDFYIPMLYMPRSDLVVISTALDNFRGPFGSQWEVICAGQMITIFPILVIFLSLQKYIYKGLLIGSVKE